MIILTGASGGIGKAMLPLLAKLDKVIALYHNNTPDIDDKNIVKYQLDLSSEKEIKDFAVLIKKDFRKITIVHAATISKDALAAQLSVGDWNAVMDVGLKANFLLNRELLPLMISEKWGRIIHCSSVAALNGMPGTLAYATAKTGLLGMSRVIAKEYARFGITSNVLALGYFNSGLIETLSEKIKNTLLEEIPSKKLGDPSNIASAIEFLIKSDYTNGGVINIDGGM